MTATPKMKLLATLVLWLARALAAGSGYGPVVAIVSSLMAQGRLVEAHDMVMRDEIQRAMEQVKLAHKKVLAVASLDADCVFLQEAAKKTEMALRCLDIEQRSLACKKLDSHEE